MENSSPTNKGDGHDLPAGCVVRPEQTEGPYFVDELLNRSDIRADPTTGDARPGVPLELTFNVTRMADAACVVLAGAVVDVWHCDHLGVYSDVDDPGFNTVRRKFLRGYQVTDDDGVARFTTVFPGWYFADDLTDEIHAMEPYSEKGQRTLRNAGDGIYAGGGSQLTLDVTEEGDGLAAVFDIALQFS